MSQAFISRKDLIAQKALLGGLTIFGAGLIAALQILAFPWIAVMLHSASPSSDVSAVSIALEVLSRKGGASFIHVLNGALFACTVSYATWIFLRSNHVARWPLALAFGIAAATSPFAPAAIFDPKGAEGTLLLAAFVTFLADVEGAVTLPLLARCALAAAAVLIDPIAIVTVAAYSFCLSYRSRERRSPAIAATGAVAVALWLLADMHSLGRSAALATELSGSAATIILLAVGIFGILPAALYARRKGLFARLGLVDGERATSSGIIMGAAAAAQGLLPLVTSSSLTWLMAEIAILAVVLQSFRASERASRFGIALAAVIIGCQLVLIVHPKPIFRFSGLSAGAVTVSEALFESTKGRDPICIASPTLLKDGVNLAGQKVYGSVRLVDKPSQCVASAERDTRLVAIGPAGLADWGSGGIGLVRAAGAERGSHRDLPIARGVVSPTALHGVFATAVNSPSGVLRAFVVKAGFTDTFECAWRKGDRILSFAAGNPLQAYSAAQPVRVTVTAETSAHVKTLLEKDIMPMRGPVAWTYYELALPAAVTGCGKLTFSASAPTGRAVATWVSFAAPVIR